jgi:hypothetical protein
VRRALCVCWRSSLFLSFLDSFLDALVVMLRGCLARCVDSRLSVCAALIAPLLNCVWSFRYHADECARSLRAFQALRNPMRADSRETRLLLRATSRAAAFRFPCFFATRLTALPFELLLLLCFGFMPDESCASA